VIFEIHFLVLLLLICVADHIFTQVFEGLESGAENMAMCKIFYQAYFFTQVFECWKVALKIYTALSNVKIHGCLQ